MLTRYLLPTYTFIVFEHKISLRSKCIKIKKKYFRFFKQKTHTKLETISKTFFKFQKDQPKTVRGVVLTRYLPPKHVYSIEARKMSKLNM